MSKRRAGTSTDRFYQDWTFERTLEENNQPLEWSIPTPRPIQAAAGGRYHAIEIHSIEWYGTPYLREDHNANLVASLSSVTRLDQDR
ncbi:unnamed protein product, partial [marine sediment metagenome]